MRACVGLITPLYGVHVHIHVHMGWWWYISHMAEKKGAGGFKTGRCFFVSISLSAFFILPEIDVVSDTGVGMALERKRGERGKGER